MNFEDILEEVGDFGYYQKRVVLLYLIAAAILLPLYCMTTLFMVSTPKHLCKVWQFINLTIDEQISLVSPLVVDSYGVKKHDSCNMYDIDYDYLANVANISIYKQHMNLTELPIKSCTNGWVYDTTNYDATAATALDLVCDRSQYVNLALSIGSIGTIIGTPFFGWLSDKIGRRKTFQVTVFVCIISTMSPTILRDTTSFLIFRAINGLLLPSFYQLPFIILIESVGPRARTIMNSVACLAWVGGQCLLALIAYLTRDWVLLNMISSATIIIFFLYWKILPESPRWLIVNNKYEEAEKQLLEMAKLNGKPQPQQLISKLKSVSKSLTSDESEKVDNAIMVFMRNPGLRRNIFILTSNWVCCAAVYYGIQLNLYNFSGNEFLNFFLLSVVEFPAYLVGWFAIETRLGRRWTFSMFLFLCGISLCVPSLFPPEYSTFTTIMAMIGKFCSTLCFMVVYQQGAEMYPTAIRNQGLGVGSMISSLATFIIPHVIYLAPIWVSLFIMGLLSIIFSVISTLLPETLNVNLPQTIQEGNIFGKNQKYFSLANTKTITRIETNTDGKEMRNLSFVNSNNN